jgi:hypothetical protein
MPTSVTQGWLFMVMRPPCVPQVSPLSPMPASHSLAAQRECLVGMGAPLGHRSRVPFARMPPCLHIRMRLDRLADKVRLLTPAGAPAAAVQYYFETIFPRIPKPVHDDLVSKLTAMGLPSRAVGNAGQGGPDRRGIEEANRRPASVKASLCVRSTCPIARTLSGCLADLVWHQQLSSCGMALQVRRFWAARAEPGHSARGGPRPGRWHEGRHRRRCGPAAAALPHRAWPRQVQPSLTTACSGDPSLAHPSTVAQAAP